MEMNQGQDYFANFSIAWVYKVWWTNKKYNKHNNNNKKLGEQVPNNNKNVINNLGSLVFKMAEPLFVYTFVSFCLNK